MYYEIDLKNPETGLVFGRLSVDELDDKVYNDLTGKHDITIEELLARYNKNCIGKAELVKDKIKPIEVDGI